MDISHWIKNHQILDGGVGTSLCDQGLDLKVDSPHHWNEQHPEKVASVHSTFIEAGAQGIHTNSFAGLSAKAPYETGKRAAEIAARTADYRALVIGSIGPLGEKRPDARARTRSLVKGLIDGGAACIHLETLYEPKEAEVLLTETLHSATVPVFASVACQLGKQGPETILGQPLETFFEELSTNSLSAIGMNCALTPADMASVIPALKSLNKPVIAQPTPSPDGTRQLSSEEFSQQCLRLLDLGATLIGGCCGTTHQDIRALASAT